MKKQRFSSEGALRPLMDFQRRTVDYAFERLFEANDSTDRFLVADEVGLGKTMVARGIAARAIEELQDKVRRVDIVYVCSNAAIARQNIDRLHIDGLPSPVRLDRLSMLPLSIDELAAHRISLVAFTPGTSLNVKGSSGRVEERALIMALLEHERCWGNSAVGTRGRNILRVGVDVHRFDARIAAARRQLGDAARNKPAREFWKRLRKRRDLRRTWEELREHYKRTDSRIPPEIVTKRRELVGELRHLLAGASLDALQPDLIILDEFQRFAHLLSGTGDDAELARELFEWSHSSKDERARVLMLSATPYKMFTLDSERATDDHYKDLLKTIEFLCREDSQRMRDASGALDAYTRAVDLATRGSDDGLVSLTNARSGLERELKRVMCRTERLAATADHGGLLAELTVPPGLALTPPDVAGYVCMRSLANRLRQGEPADYWKSIPYALTFLHQYQYRARIDQALETGSDLAVDDLRVDPDRPIDCLTLPTHITEAFGQIDLSNPRLRALAAQTTDSDAARALWVPPAMPYYELSAPFDRLAQRGFTKRLVFSAWTAVPRAAASVLTYEAERLTYAQAYKGKKIEYSNPSKGTPIRFRKTRGKIQGLSAWAWLYPSTTLADLTDPLRLWSEAARVLTPSEMLDAAEAALASDIATLVQRCDKEYAPPGKADTNWYWVAPILIDHARSPETTEAFFDCGRLRATYKSLEAIARTEIGEELLDEAVDAVRRVIDDQSMLGAVPDDLGHVLAYLGTSGAATCGLRSLTRGGPMERRLDPEVRYLASGLASGMRDMFNRPYCIAAVRCSKDRVALKDKPYWLRAIGYSYSGGIQAMLDEYAHVLNASADDPRERTQEMLNAIAVGASTVDAVNPGASAIKLRTHHAAAFGLGRAADDAQTDRAIHLRDAFNSPFKPFALISTSVGQEGLDFHKYCHAVVHWNLPSSPVDFEQREGRVHRYKGHAVRKNVAVEHADESRTSTDPWTAAFEAASAARSEAATQMVPFWVYPEVTDPSRHSLIIREVPVLPLSKDVVTRQRLQRTLGAYRMVFGQPRQEDLIEYLLGDLDAEAMERIRAAAAINLEPPRSL